MNRLSLSEGQDLQSPACSQRIVQERKAVRPGNHVYSVVGPLHYEPNYAYPLVIWLHEDGGDERELHQVLPLISLRNYVAIAPRGTWDDQRSDRAWQQSTDGILAAQDHVLQCLETASKRYHINRQNVFVSGQGAGGTMALRVAMNCPLVITGASSLGGPFPSGNMPLRNIALARGLPLLIAHEREGLQYSEENVCRDLRLLHAAGISVTLRQYSGGEPLKSRMLHDLNVWMMEIVTGQQTPQLQSSWPQAESLN